MKLEHSCACVSITADITTYRKIYKVQKNWDRQPTKRRKKIYNPRSSSYQNATLPNVRYR